METIPGNIYDFPKYYDLIFGSDWKAEVDFLTACFDKHVSGKTHRIFEPACGTGRLIFRLAQLGYSMGGLDLNPKAIDYCQRRLERGGHAADVFVGDMTDFRLKRKVDASFNTINSFRHLTTERHAVAHLECMSQALRKGGVYVLGFHLTPTKGPATEEESWSARRGNLQVNTHMWLMERNLPSREEWYGMQFDVYTPTRSFRISDRILFRTYTRKQFEKLIGRVSGLEIEAIYDFSYDIHTPIDLADDTEDIVAVLKKR